MKNINNKNFFIGNDDIYKSTVEPLNNYIKLVENYVSKVSDKSIDDVRRYIKSKHKYRDRVVKFRERDIDGNVAVKTDTLSNYINYYISNDDIMVPSGTVYFNHKKKKSLHAEFINVNVNIRKEHKNLAFKYKMDGLFDKYNYHNTIQKTMKIFNNSLSGAYASGSTVLNNPTAHYTLTSITRCVSGIGNAISESLISGNKHFRDPDITLEHINLLSFRTDKNRIREIIELYNLYIPTVDDVVLSIYKSASYYWDDEDSWRIIREFIERVSDEERVFIYYHNNFFNLRNKNGDLVKKFIDTIINYELIEPEGNVDEALKDIDESTIMLASHVLYSRLKGKKIDDYTEEDKLHILSVSIATFEALSMLEPIIKTFFITDVFPPSISYIKEMVRNSIVLSDTDSTCATYQDWVSWYLGNLDFNDKAIGVSAIVMTIVTQVMDHYIKLLAANMNISKENAKYLAMKNEFFWDVFVNTNVSKHYFANIAIQEGNVYDLSPVKTLEKKGVHLIASTAYSVIRDISEDMMVDILQTVNKGEKIDLEKYINIVLEAEQMLLDKMKSGSSDIYKLEKIKEAKAYKLDEYHSPYFFYMLWEKIFSDKYGHAPDPTYMAIKLPTIINKKQDMDILLSKLPEDKRSELVSLLNVAGKTEIKTFKLPLVNVYTKGIPEELKEIIDYKRIILDNCKVLYIILESIGFYVKEGSTVTEQLGREFNW